MRTENHFSGFLDIIFTLAACFFILSSVFSFLDKFILNDLIYENKPGFKSDIEISYETFKSITNSENCYLVKKVDGRIEIPKFEHYKCGTANYVWASKASILSFSIYKDEPSWLIGNDQ